MSRGNYVDPVAVRWLTEQGIWHPSAQHVENMERVMAAAHEFAARSVFGAQPGKQWARDLIARYRAGEPLLSMQIKLAMAALDIREPVLRNPDNPVPRPDAKDRAAGDVDVTL